MAEVVLVNPPLTHEERYGVHFQSGGMTPPLGLASLAAVLTKNGISVKIIDGAISNNYFEVLNEILHEKPRYVGLTASTMSIHNAASVARMVKVCRKPMTTIIGGPHVTAVPVETLKMFPEFDVGVIGEAEVTIWPLLHVLGKGETPSQVGGVVFRMGENVYQTHRTGYLGDLDSLPMPAWNLLPDLAKYYCPPVHTVKRLPAALLVTSRGCPAKCTFCDRSVFGNQLRAYSAGYVLRMMQELHNDYGIREFQFRDDNFLAFRPRLVELCKLLKEEKLDVVWSLAGRVDMVNPEILEMLHDAGCWQIWYGIESGSQRILDVIKKHTTLEKISESVKWTRDAGIDVGGFFMLGHPTETPSSMEQTIKLSKELPLNEAHFTFFTPLPGSEIYETIDDYGEFDRDWRKASCWNPVFIPKGITDKQLVNYWKRASLGFYARPRIIWGYLRKIKSLRHVKVYLNGLLALLESLFIKKYGGNIAIRN